MIAALYPAPATARQYWSIDSNGGIAWNVTDGDRKLAVEIPDGGFTTATCHDKGMAGSYSIQGTVIGSGAYDLQPGDTLAFSARITALPPGNTL